VKGKASLFWRPRYLALPWSGSLVVRGGDGIHSGRAACGHITGHRRSKAKQGRQAHQDGSVKANHAVTFIGMFGWAAAA